MFPKVFGRSRSNKTIKRASTDCTNHNLKEHITIKFINVFMVKKYQEERKEDLCAAVYLWKTHYYIVINPLIHYS